MRWIFYTLLAANLGYLIWQLVVIPQANSDAQNMPAHSADGAVPAIKLLSEAGDQAEPLNLEDVLLQQPSYIADAPAPSIISAGNEVVPSGEKLQQCHVFGPFVSVNEQEDFVRYLEGLKFVPEVRAELHSMAAHYWAYIEPFVSRQEALLMMAKLKSKGIDSFLVGEGELVNGLSLGVFEDSQQIDVIAVSLQDLGLDIKVVEKSRSYEYGWVLLPFQSVNLTAQELAVKVGEIYPSLKYIQKVCKSVASSD